MRFIYSDNPYDKLIQAVAMQSAKDLGGAGCTPKDRVSARFFLHDLGLSNKQIGKAARLMFENRVNKYKHREKKVTMP